MRNGTLNILNIGNGWNEFIVTVIYILRIQYKDGSKRLRKEESVIPVQS